MGIFNFEDPQTGKLYKFTVAGDAPSNIEFGQITQILEATNAQHRKEKEYKKIIYTGAHDMAAAVGKVSGNGFVVENKGLMWFLTFGLGILGSLLFIVPNIVLLGKKGIKNNGIYHENATNRGWIAWMVFVFLVSFYLVLYFRSEYAVNWTYLVDPISEFLSGNPAGHWFVYGFMYCTVMTVMAVRMYIKYRHNIYQTVRTTSVLFFQIVFAFLIPEIMVRLQMPYYDFKNAFLIGFFMAFMIGPVFFVLLETSAIKGFRAALCFDVGVIVADILFISLAYFSSFQLLENLSSHPGLYVFGGTILLVYGLTNVFKKESVKQENKIRITKGDYFSLCVKGSVSYTHLTLPTNREV